MSQENFNETFQKLQETTKFLHSKISLKPKVGIILGSGLGEFAKDIQVDTIIPYAQIPHFIQTTIIGHSGNMIFGKISGVDIVALQGRSHFYEGHSIQEVVFPTRTLALLGIEILILTNSAGGLGDGMQAGDFMILDDHLNLTGTNPLIGPNIKEFGPRFPDMTEAYDRKLVLKLEACMQKHKVRFHKGVYGGLTGPTYETPAEVRYLKTIGCHAVGMSTVSECIAANHMGVRVAAISCISNLAAGISKHKLSHDEVTDNANKVGKDFSNVLKDFIGMIV